MGKDINTEQTYDEKVAMFMKSTKRELVDMLIGCTGVLSKEEGKKSFTIKSKQPR